MDEEEEERLLGLALRLEVEVEARVVAVPDRGDSRRVLRHLDTVYLRFFGPFFFYFFLLLSANFPNYKFFFYRVPPHLLGEVDGGGLLLELRRRVPLLLRVEVEVEHLRANMMKQILLRNQKKSGVTRMGR